jgi:hypothetical protein
MQNFPSVRLDYKMSPEQSFQELHSEYSLEQIDDSLFSWFSDHMSKRNATEKEIREEHHLYYLIRKAIYQSQRIANDSSIFVPELSHTITELKCTQKNTSPAG